MRSNAEARKSANLLGLKLSNLAKPLKTINTKKTSEQRPRKKAPEPTCPLSSPLLGQIAVIASQRESAMAVQLRFEVMHLQEDGRERLSQRPALINCQLEN